MALQVMRFQVMRWMRPDVCSCHSCSHLHTQLQVHGHKLARVLIAEATSSCRPKVTENVVAHVLFSQPCLIIDRLQVN